jgi:hypothetical protein
VVKKLDPHRVREVAAHIDSEELVAALSPEKIAALSPEKRQRLVELLTQADPKNQLPE